MRLGILLWTVLLIGFNPLFAQQKPESSFEALRQQTVNALLTKDFAEAAHLARELERYVDAGLAPANQPLLAHYGLIAEIYFSLGDQFGAANSYEKAARAARREGLWLSKESLGLRYQFGSILSLIGRQNDAKDVTSELLDDLERLGKLEHPIGLDVSILLGSIQMDLRAFDTARLTFQTVLERIILAKGPDRHEFLARNGLAQSLTELGLFDDALVQSRIAAQISSNLHDPESDMGLRTRLRFGMALERAGQISEARTVVQSVYRSAKRTLPATHDINQWSLRTLEKIERAEQRLLTARSLNLQISKNALKKDDPLQRYDALKNMAAHDLAEGDFDGYEGKLFEAIQISRESQLIAPQMVAETLISLAKFLIDYRGDLQSAAPLLQEAIEILTRDLGPDHLETLRAKAETLHAKKIEIQTEPLWRMARKSPVFWDGSDTGKLLTAAELGILLKLTQAERAAGHSVRSVSSALQLVDALIESKRFDSATQVLTEELKLQVSKRNMGHPPDRQIDYMLLNALGSLFIAQEKFSEAVQVFKDGSDEVIAFLRDLQWLDSVGGSSQFYLIGQLYGEKYATAAFRAAEFSTGEARQELVGRLFEAVQMAGYNAVSAAIAGAAVRRTHSDPELRYLSAMWQDAVRARQSGNASAARNIDDIRLQMNAAYSKYSEMLVRPPIALSHLQNALLKEDEALIAILPATSQSGAEGALNGFVIAVTKTDAEVIELPLRWDQLVFDILNLHESLDPSSAKAAGAARAPLASLTTPITQASKAAPFAFGSSHRLYKAFFGEPRIANLIDSKPNWTILPFGETMSIPFATLVLDGQNKTGPTQKTAKELREMRWLGHEKALRVLPSTSALQTLRTTSSKEERSSETLSYVAFGDPSFDAPSVSRSLSLNETEGVLLSRLPGTRREVLELMRFFGADRSAVFLGNDANESTVERLQADSKLQDAKILHFATHGLLGGTLNGLNEPALALSPLADSTQETNGFLTASEAANLELGADWVILSACDTAGNDGLNGNGLGGLVQAFFTAGAQNLLVSHWRVDDLAAERLVTETVKMHENGFGKAEALRQAMKALAADQSRDLSTVPNAHPSIWAPFVLLGAG